MVFIGFPLFGQETVGSGPQLVPVALLEHAGGGDGLGALAGVDSLPGVPANLHAVLADADPVRAEPDAGDQQHDGAADRQPGAERQRGERDHGLRLAGRAQGRSQYRSPITACEALGVALAASIA